MKSKYFVLWTIRVLEVTRKQILYVGPIGELHNTLTLACWNILWFRKKVQHSTGEKTYSHKLKLNST